MYSACDPWRSEDAEIYENETDYIYIICAPLDRMYVYTASKDIIVFAYGFVGMAGLRPFPRNRKCRIVVNERFFVFRFLQSKVVSVGWI